MRSHLTPSEHALWQRVRGGELGVQFRRHVPVGRYIADFLAASARLVVEVNGGYHQRRRGAAAPAGAATSCASATACCGCQRRSSPRTSQALALIAVAR